MHAADMCEVARARGNERFRVKEYEEAIKLYGIAIKAAESDEARVPTLPPRARAASALSPRNAWLSRSSRRPRS